MKKLEIIIKSEKLEELKTALNELGVTGMMLTNIMGFGNQRGYTQIYRGAKYTVNLLPKVKVETVVCDEIYEQVLTKIQETVTTGNIGDGKIFVYQVTEAVRIRTGERGEDAI
ncbi:MAG: P-II family nitrogen regulator [Anaerotignaceae bacterium]